MAVAKDVDHDVGAPSSAQVRAVGQLDRGADQRGERKGWACRTGPEGADKSLLRGPLGRRRDAVAAETLGLVRNRQGTRRW